MCAVPARSIIEPLKRWEYLVKRGLRLRSRSKDPGNAPGYVRQADGGTTDTESAKWHSSFLLVEVSLKRLNGSDKIGDTGRDQWVREAAALLERFHSRRRTSSL